MRLKTQLAIVAAASLLLPWAGCQYVRETEIALRENQQLLLGASAQSVAAGMRATDIRALAERPGEGALYLPPLARPPTLDGYPGDWTPDAPALAPLQGSDAIRFRSAAFDTQFYLFIDADVAQAARFSVVAVDSAGRLARYRFESAAPGVVLAELQQSDRDAASVVEPRVRGYWVETAAGPQLEARIARDLATNGLGLVVERADGKPLAASFDAAIPPAPIGRIAAIQSVVERYRQPGVRLHVVDSAGWIRAASGGLLEPAAQTVDRQSLIAVAYRRLLADVGRPEQLLGIARGVDRNGYVTRALANGVTTAWIAADTGERAAAIVAAAAPIADTRGVAGAVVMNQASASLLLPTNAALTRLATLTLLAAAGTFGVLLAFASWLSWRVRQLSRAADAAMNPRGEIFAALPSSDSRDEIGSLSRSFSTLLERIGDYNLYLKDLTGRLSHELRTPMAVVSSSLENLEAESLNETQAEYAGRAKTGIERLQHLVRAMSEATRVEEAAALAEAVDFDLGAVVAGATEGYRDVYATQLFAVDCAAGPFPLRGAPELLVQLLDKLVDNAASFAAAGATITIALKRTGDGYALSVSNPGPLLPDSMREQIFESLVTLRENKQSSHLGFGLHIARLIAESHGGTLSAENLSDGSGVRFTLSLRGA